MRTACIKSARLASSTNRCSSFSLRTSVCVLLLLYCNLLPGPQEWNVQQLCYEVDVEPYARTRDAAINQLAAAAGVEVSAHVSHTLYVGAHPGVPPV